jgi:hypothetical protein
MEQLRETENPLVLRTDFSNQAAWDAICAKIQKPVGLMRFRAAVEFVDDVQYAAITKDQLLEIVPKEYEHAVIILVDEKAVNHPDYPLLVIDLYDQPGREFRAIPSQIQAIENNLSLANMDFEEFAESTDGSGVFRGFPKN